MSRAALSKSQLLVRKVPSFHPHYLLMIFMEGEEDELAFVRTSANNLVFSSDDDDETEIKDDKEPTVEEELDFHEIDLQAEDEKIELRKRKNTLEVLASRFSKLSSSSSGSGSGESDQV
jgi:hypothetical protein